MKKIFFSVMLMFFGFLNTYATHIVGGEFKYENLGGNNYRITFYLYRDCLNGDPKALETDESGSFGIFDLTNNTWEDRFNLGYLTKNNTPTNFNNECLKNPPAICLNRMDFQFMQHLNTNHDYLIMYQRCCRNNAVNIDNSSGTNVGSTFFTFIKPQYGANNSAVFKNYPPQIICINNPLFYDNGAIDPDGDSLSYELCDAKDFNNITSSNPGINDLTTPPYNTIPYSFGFSSINPMHGNPQITLNTKTGMITGTPNLQGRFVVTVCCTEWRNGIAININRRDFQFEVTNCSKVVVANIPSFSDLPNVYKAECDTTLVQFRNISSGGFNFHWDFGVQNILSDTSNLFEPTYNYPDTGTYVVKLIVNPGSTCQDSISRLVKVYPKFHAKFTVAGLLCPNEIIRFTDSSWGSLAMPNKWRWSFGDNSFDTIKNPSHAFQSGEWYTTLVANNAFGCSDTASVNIKIKSVNVRTTQDTIVLKNVDVKVYSSGAIGYLWTPNLYLNDPTICCPTFNFPDTGKYQYYIQATTLEGCTNRDTLNIIVVGEPILYVPNAFSPNGDGINDILKIIQGGYGHLNYFRIFNRWGQQLFYTTNFNRFWDGTFNEKKCDDGTYFWQANATDINGKKINLQGDVLILR